MFSLFPHQKVGIKWMVKREQGVIRGGFLCDEMGLGKTIQTLCTMMLNPVPKTLIIVPNSLVDQWVTEIKNLTRFVVGRDVVVTTYSQFSPRCKKLGEFRRQHWDRIILDEGHEIRTQKSKRFKVIHSLPSDIRWVLSGTPIYNKKADYLTLLKFVTQESVNVPTISQIMLRRTKDDVQLNLPTCHFENVELEMHEEEWQVYTERFQEFCGEIKKKEDNGGPVQLYNMLLIECLLRVRQLCVHPSIFVPEYTGRSMKMDTLLRDIQSHPGEKGIVFCHFHKEMDIIQEMLGKANISTYRLDGEVPTHLRTGIINEFKQDVSHSVLVIQIKTGGQGLNIQEATRVYIMSPSWNPATELQAIARSHRTGQTKEVYVKKYIYISSDQAVNCVDESIVSLQGHKSIVCAEVLNDSRMTTQIPVDLRRAKFTQTLRKIFHPPQK